MIQHERPHAGRRESHREFETMLFELSSRFIDLPLGEVDREIEAALCRFCSRGVEHDFRDPEDRVRAASADSLDAEGVAALCSACVASASP
jgi:hypothetical protein